MKFEMKFSGNTSSPNLSARPEFRGGLSVFCACMIFAGAVVGCSKVSKEVEKIDKDSEIPSTPDESGTKTSIARAAIGSGSPLSPAQFDRDVIPHSIDARNAAVQQLVKLQEALLAGRIDKQAYEELKADIHFVNKLQDAPLSTLQIGDSSLAPPLSPMSAIQSRDDSSAPAIAERHVTEQPPPRVQAAESREELSVQDAIAIVAQGKIFMPLDDLTDLSPDVARVLAQHKGHLFFRGLSTISPEVVIALAANKRELYLDGLKEISIETARELAKRDDLLSLDGIRDISPEIASVLATHRNKLSLNGLTRLTLPAATALAEHKGGWEPGTSNISQDSIRALSESNGLLSLDGLTTLSPDIASALAKHQGYLSLNGIKELSAASATELSKHPSHLSLDGVESLPSHIAEILNTHLGDLSLHGVRRILVADGIELPLLLYARPPAHWKRLTSVDDASTGKSSGFTAEIDDNAIVVSYADKPFKSNDRCLAAIAVRNRISSLLGKGKGRHVKDSIFEIELDRPVFVKAMAIVINQMPGDLLLFGDSLEDLEIANFKLKK
jgi:hypothetical protein